MSSTPEIPDATAGRLCIDGPRELQDAAQVWDELASLAGAEGWVCRPHRVERYAPSGAGMLLDAEVAAGAVSIHVRHNADGWLAWRYEEVPDGDDLIFDERLVSTEGAPRLRYRVVWRRETDEDGIEVYRPFAARFAGWGD